MPLDCHNLVIAAQRTLGIDLSSDPRKTAVCSIAWEGRKARFELLTSGKQATLDNDALVGLIKGARLSGIDAPFGWPVKFSEAVDHWSKGQSDWPEREDFAEFRLRLTDELITKPRSPLSVSSNYIGVTAMRAAQILSRLGPKVDRAGLRGPVIEIYPAAALFAWGLPSLGYKKAKGKETRRGLVEELGGQLQKVCPLSDEQIELCLDSDDVLDALVAALVVRARLIGATKQPSKSDVERARIEGWIHVPTCSISELRT